MKKPTLVMFLAATLIFGFSGFQAHAELPLDNATQAELETDATGHAAEMTPEIAAKDGYVKMEKKESVEKDSQEKKND
ncbi:MAG: hypothetical protein ACXVBE_00385 [Bdellovibrionota bacterium]